MINLKIINKLLVPLFSLLILFGVSTSASAENNTTFDTGGFAKVTGGLNGQTVTVTNSTDLLAYVAKTEPYIIQVKGKIALPKGMHKVNSNKTLVGLEDAAITTGGLNIKQVNNVIIQNIDFSKSNDDEINVETSTNIWIDHNTFSDSYDGLVDIKRESDFVTVSWNHFKDHQKTALIGHSDSYTKDRGKLHVTYHHNWFDGTNSRHPRVRFGEVHVYNNYYGGTTDYGIGVGVEAKVYSEKNLFEGTLPVKYWDKSSMKGYIKDVGSIMINPDKYELRPEGITWKPSDYYTYKLDDAADVEGIVKNGAGLGKPIPDTPVTPEPPQVTNPNEDLQNLVDSLVNENSLLKSEIYTLTEENETLKEDGSLSSNKLNLIKTAFNDFVEVMNGILN